MAEILYLTHRIPYPPDKGDKIRSYHVLRHLAARHRVHLGCFIDDPADRRHIATLRPWCASSCFVDLSPSMARVASLRALLSGEPMSMAYYRSARLQRWTDSLLQDARVDAALAYSSPMAQYLERVLPGGVRRVIDFVDVDSEKWSAYAATRRWPLSALYRREGLRLRQAEARIARDCDGASFVSAAEAELFRQRAPDAAQRVGHFNNGVDALYFRPQPDYPRPYPLDVTVLAFTGAMDYWPNIEAVDWFARAVLPALLARRPALRFYIVGARPAPRVRQLAALPGVVVTGAVPDTRPYLAHAAMAVAPLRIARGVQNKVLEAMAMQKTVLASPQALEGIDAVPGGEVLVAHDAPAWIARIGYFLAHGPELGQAARQRVLRDYAWSGNLSRLETMLGLAPASDLHPARLALPDALA
ncbi:MAG: TIGR03087 family PEP-CTERM/XrtA system glycosyltransferase [Pseudomonadota bacterium]